MDLYKPADHDFNESVTPLVQFFELVHIGDTIAQMIQVYYDRELVGCHIARDFYSASTYLKAYRQGSWTGTTFCL